MNIHPKITIKIIKAQKLTFRTFLTFWGFYV